MTKILFVCHGNICRSTMAEFVLKDMVDKQGLGKNYTIASAATSRDDLGSPVHQGTRKKLAQHGIGCQGKRATLMTPQDYHRYDLLIGMDEENLRGMRRIAGGDPQAKMHLLLEYTGAPRNIADPWYTGNFDETWDDVWAGCTALLTRLEGENAR